MRESLHFFSVFKKDPDTLVELCERGQRVLSLHHRFRFLLFSFIP